jgi:HD-like signal output (HDOD) protein
MLESQSLDTESETTAHGDKDAAALIKDIGIPPRPAILEHLAEEMRAEEPNFQHVTALISRDVGLAAGLLKLANASYFGLSQKVRTVHEALLILGLAAAARTIAGLALRRMFPPGPELERFWDASDKTAQLAGWLVHEVGRRHNVGHEEAYTYSLFRDCGIPILLRRFPGYKHILDRANQDPEHCFTCSEEAELPTNHAQVGGLLASSWWLPEVTCAAIRLHHDANTLRRGHTALGLSGRRMIALGQLAEYLYSSTSGMSQTHEWDKLGTICMEQLELDGEAIAPLQLRAAAFLDSLERI